MNINGGVIGKQNASSGSVATGVWALHEFYLRKISGQWPSGSVPMGDVDYTICAGGGARGAASGTAAAAWGGGGAGGYINSYGTAVSALTLLTTTPYTVTIGAAATAYATNGSNSSITGVDTSSVFTITAIGGGGGGSGASTSDADLDGKDGGSGGGGASLENGQNPTYAGTPGSGTTNQGGPGSTGTARPVFPWYCTESWGAPLAQCNGFPGQSTGGGGGGASGGNLGTSISGQIGVQNSITGSNVYRSGGGDGYNNSSGGNGYDQAGGGGSGSYPYGKNGILILRYSNAYTISNPGGGLTIATSTVSSDKVSQITAGTGILQFAAN